jgi:hypothetical protein
MSRKSVSIVAGVALAMGLGIGVSAAQPQRIHPGAACAARCDSQYSWCLQTGQPQYVCDQQRYDCYMACQGV